MRADLSLQRRCTFQFPAPVPQDIQDMLNDNNITRERFLVLNYTEKFPDGKKQLEAWVREGKLKNRETVVEGLENTGRAFVAMMSGGNIGKQVVKVSEWRHENDNQSP